MRILTLLSICIFLLSCSSVQEPEFRRLDSFKLRSASLLDVELSFETVYYNPNGFGLSVKETDILVSIDSMELGRFTQPTLTQVGLKAEFAIPLKGSLSLTKLLSLGLQKKIGKEVLIQAVGTTKVGKAGIYSTQKIQYAGKQVLDEALLKGMR